MSRFTRSVRLAVPTLAVALTCGAAPLWAQKPAPATRTVVITASDQMKYEYLCTFPGHFAVGMKGVLVVK